ncbi:MAG: formylglycine-generating enzyme family protein [Prevotellaceae bacterium]|jgi:formylglycine-generating enzyme required for sulfatase activity|nr:formylglycine-generating enzyme family protein [Prevotellaceae bacterium]
MKSKKMFLAVATAAAIAATLPALAARPSYEPEMVQVEGGTFLMGCTIELGSDCLSDENPAHSVALSSFKISKHEVTQAQWLAVMGSWPHAAPSPTYGTGDRYPAYNVSWEDAQQFIAKLNQLTGKSYRLPTEAEWEYAARGGAKSYRYRYSGSNTVGDVAWHSDNAGRATHAVGAKQPNELGIYDMSGNVWEWCSDKFGSYSGYEQVDPTGPTRGFNRVLRGGGWNNTAPACRATHRSYSPGHHYHNIGFRVVLP